MVTQISILTKSGNIIRRKATVTEWLSSDGRGFKTATIGKSKADYRLVESDMADYPELWSTI